MSRSSNKRYRSYREKKTQTKKFRSYFIRISLLLLLFSIFTSLIAISIRVPGDTMSPTLKTGDSIILLPTKNLNILLQKKSGIALRRGELVVSRPNYGVDPKLLEIILDPIVRIFTLQKKSLFYDNSNYKGRSELLRVVGFPGDSIKIKDSTVYIRPSGDNFFLNEFELTDIDYDISKSILPGNWKDNYPFSMEMKEIYIPENYYFLISDNRFFQNDSRIYGLVHKDGIIGKVIAKYWPLNEFKIF